MTKLEYGQNVADLQGFRLDRQRLLKQAEQLSSKYAGAESYPHIIIDDFLPSELLDAVIDEYPDPDEPFWMKMHHNNSRKLALNAIQFMGPVTVNLFNTLNSAPFLEFLEILTGISPLISDPRLEGGGLHQIERNGFLKIHADFNVHPLYKLDRRLNLLIYLNKDWEEAYGGHFELWDREMSRCIEKILPTFNRMVVFSTTDYSYHGHPDPLTCPPDRCRRSLALYYYTNGRPEEEKSATHSTLYQQRPKETPTLHERLPSKVRAKLRRVLPPILADYMKL